MAEQPELAVGQWFTNAEGETLEIIAYDSDEGVIEIQYFDGAVEEVDIDSWNESGMTPAAEPEDWSGPFDDLERDDFGDTDQAMHPEDWSGPTNTIEMEEEVDFTE